ncbi:2-dehydropantoate 2-reductase [Galdieria sulphuraria]|nr:2-dehydropantoate 2-reductase [Galdieria sulphuraria]
MAISFCNGIGNLETVASVVGVNRAAAAVTYEAVQRINSTKIIHWSTGRTVLADTLTNSPELNANIQFLYDVLRQQNLPIELLKSVDARKEIWKKLAVNCVINPLATIIHGRNGLLSDRIPQSLFEGICCEIIMTAERNGVILELDELMAQVLETIRESSNNICSTLQDIQRGRSTEIDALNGAVVRLARNFGLLVPYCETLYHLIKAIEKGQDTNKTA